MGETLQKFGELTKQYAADIDAIYQSYEKAKEAIGTELEPEVRDAVDEVKASADQHMQEMKNLTKTYIDNITELKEGDQPDQDLPETGPDPKPEINPQIDDLTNR